MSDLTYQNLLDELKQVLSKYVSKPEEFSEKILDIICMEDLHLEDRSAIVFFKKEDIKDATSVKLENLVFDWRRLLIDSAESILALAGASSSPILLTLAGLIVLKKFWTNVSIKLNEYHAGVLWHMWNNNSDFVYTANVNSLNDINSLIKELKLREMDSGEFQTTLKELEDLKCIKKLEDNNWWLLEKIEVVGWNWKIK